MSLSLGETKVAVEISVTTSPDHELANVRKCIEAGYNQVFVVSPERKHLQKLKKLIGDALEDEDRMVFLLPEEIIDHLDRIAAQGAGTEQKVKVYTVKVQYQPAGKDAQAKREAIAKVIAGAIRRMKDK